jgi:hypothetical protein
MAFFAFDVAMYKRLLSAQPAGIALFALAYSERVELRKFRSLS